MFQTLITIIMQLILMFYIFIAIRFDIGKTAKIACPYRQARHVATVVNSSLPKMNNLA